MEPLDFVVRALDAKKRMAPNGEEYWMGRDLQPIMGYDTWRRFDEVIRKAVQACDNSGINSSYHFVDTDKVIKAGKGAELKRGDWYLTRYACYLIAMNGDASKAEIATTQTYFTVQTRRQEISDEERRVALRETVRVSNKILAGTAKEAGVTRFDHFNNAGYMGLYGMGLPDIKVRKRIDAKENLLDRVGRAELAMHEFRITQTQQKLERERIHGESAAINTHRKVGEEVREAVRRIGGTLPENLPAEEPISAVKRRLKTKNRAAGSLLGQGSSNER
ncbi:MAG TPA: DNA damage-inducible protein D [Terriglobales bacterium]|nr:DNA damage-inducible protein D [Terriglobales bacterium]